MIYHDIEVKSGTVQDEPGSLPGRAISEQEHDKIKCGEFVITGQRDILKELG